MLYYQDYHTYIHTYTHTYIQKYIHSHMHTYINSCKHALIHTHTHTHYRLSWIFPFSATTTKVSILKMEMTEFSFFRDCNLLPFGQSTNPWKNYLAIIDKLFCLKNVNLHAQKIHLQVYHNQRIVDIMSSGLFTICSCDRLKHYSSPGLVDAGSPY